MITTHDRPELLLRSLDAIWPQVDHPIIIAHRAPYAARYRAIGVTVLDYDHELPNISAMWNLGLLEAEIGSYAEAHDVAVLNDDATVPPRWFEQITAAMRQTGAVAGGAHQHGHPNTSHLTTFDHPDIAERLPGFAFILDGTAGLRLDEQFRWWWGDTDLDWRARQQGGTVLVPGTPVDHPPNGGGSTVGELATIAAADRERFIAKWGTAPW